MDSLWCRYIIFKTTTLWCRYITFTICKLQKNLNSGIEFKYFNKGVRQSTFSYAIVVHYQVPGTSIQPFLKI